MNINLLKLFELCSKHQINFTYITKSEISKNQITYTVTKDGGNKNNLTVNLVDIYDKNLSELIDNKIKELEDIFQ